MMKVGINESADVGTVLARRNRRAALVLAVVAVLAALLGGRVQRWVVSVLVLRSDAPSDAAIAAIAEAEGYSTAVLGRIWLSGATSSRLFVMDYLSHSATRAPATPEGLQPLILEAVRDFDPGVREMGFTLLGSHKYPDLRRLLHEQLADPDAALRVLGLQHLLPMANSNDVAIVWPLLNDEDPRVVVCAATVLRRVTGQDFGIRLSQALPRFAAFGDAPLPNPDWAAIQPGRDALDAWLRGHRAEFPSSSLALPAGPLPVRQPPFDFSLEDLAGRRIRLSALRGKTVVLAFWNATNQITFNDAATLRSILARRGDRLAVVATDVSSLADHHHEDGDDHAADEIEPKTSTRCHDGPSAAASPSIQVKTVLPDAASQLVPGLNMVFDREGRLASRFSVNELPSYVIFDAEGRPVRRVTGSRTRKAFERMIGDATISRH